MHLKENLMTLERVIEKSLLGFFVLLGASEVPENWEPELQKVTVHHRTAQEWQTPHHDPR